jgi:hypothetical protein
MTSRWSDDKRWLEQRLGEILGALASLPREIKEAQRQKQEAEKLHQEEEAKRWKAEEIKTGTPAAAGRAY